MPELLEQIKALPKDRRKEIGEAITQTVEAWGDPHPHLGISIRQISKKHGIYESRVDLATRLAFVVEVREHELIFIFMGSHDEIQKLIKSA